MLQTKLSVLYMKIMSEYSLSLDKPIVMEHARTDKAPVD